MSSNHRSSLFVVSVACLVLTSAAMACNAPTVTPLVPMTTTAPQAVTASPTRPTTELATPISPIAIIKVETNIRNGPGTDYAILGLLASGLSVRLTGRNADKSWWQIEFPASPEGRAWVFGENVTVAAGVNTDALPVAGAPPPPTRTPTSVPTITSTPKSPTATATRRPPTATPRPTALSVLRADKLQVVPGECTTLRWDIDHVKAVFLNVGRGDAPVTGHDSRWVCPDVTTVYTLLIVNNDDTSQKHTLTLMVSGACGNTPIISRFEASATQIKPGQGVTFVWDVACAQFVFFKEGTGPGGRQPVTGHDQIEVQPSRTTTYRLIVVAIDGSEIKQDITINVVP